MILRKFLKVCAEATLYCVVGIGLCALHYIYGEHSTAFVSRWDGGCTGWTRDLTAEAIFGQVTTWWDFCAIGVTLWRYHPIMKGDKLSLVTIGFMGLFTVLCGITHLLGAYSNINPIYYFETHFRTFASIIDAVTFGFILVGLMRVFVVVQAKRARLEELEAKERRI